MSDMTELQRLRIDNAALRGQVSALEKGREIMMVVQAEQERWREETQAALDAAQAELAEARRQGEGLRQASENLAKAFRQAAFKDHWAPGRAIDAVYADVDKEPVLVAVRAALATPAPEVKK